jgi:branched-chain amino acid transport system ATP-binding protein
MLKLERLQAGYDEVIAVWDASLEVRAGEFVAVVGPNGAGKTTLLNAVCGLVGVRGGRIDFEGTDITRASPQERVRRGIVQCPEGRKLFPDMTVEENLLMGAYLCASGADVSRQLAEIYELFPILRERRRQLAATLSGGQQQMVALGRALMAKPRLLLLDEPSLGLAPIVVDDVFRVVQRIHQRGAAVLMVEQNVHQTLEIADRGYVLENGRVALSGAARELLGSPHVRQAYLGA